MHRRAFRRRYATHLLWTTRLAACTQMGADNDRLQLETCCGNATSSLPDALSRMALPGKRLGECWKERDRSCSNQDYLIRVGLTQPLRSARFGMRLTRLTATRPHTFFDTILTFLANLFPSAPPSSTSQHRSNRRTPFRSPRPRPFAAFSQARLPLPFWRSIGWRLPRLRRDLSAERDGVARCALAPNSRDRPPDGKRVHSPGEGRRLLRELGGRSRSPKTTLRRAPHQRALPPSGRRLPRRATL